MNPEESKGTQPETGDNSPKERNSGDNEGRRRSRRGSGRRRRKPDRDDGNNGNRGGGQGGGDDSQGQSDQGRRGGRKGGGRRRDNNNSKDNRGGGDRRGGDRSRKRRGRGGNRRSKDRGPELPKDVPEEELEPVAGLFELSNDGTGHVRYVENYYLPDERDVFVPKEVVRRHNIRTGSMVEGVSAPPRRRHGKRMLYRVEAINERDPDLHRDERPFKNLLPCDPFERFHLETPEDPDISMRIIDLLTPIGRGQRALIVAPPRTGKTVIMQKMANAISESHPEVKVVILLIDERPEEVTDMKRNTSAEVIASCLDEGTANHVKVTELTLEKLRRQVEAGHHVVCLLDSITRLGRAYNNETKHSGRILSGGVDAKTLAKPKAFFGAARTIEGGGSLTIIATALIDTGSRMDQVIFEEFKGTGNMELVLSRQLANNRTFPAIDIAMSGTRKEEKLLDPGVHHKVNVLRRVLNQLKPMEAMRLLIERMEKTSSNDEFLSKFDIDG